MEEQKNAFFYKLLNIYTQRVMKNYTKTTKSCKLGRRKTTSVVGKLITIIIIVSV